MGFYMVPRDIALRLPDQSRPDLSALYLIEHIKYESFSSDMPLSEFDLQHLGMSIYELQQRGAMGTPYLADLNNRSVFFMRTYIEYQKAEGIGCYQARRGLRVPVPIEMHYEVIYQTNYPGFISAVMQNVFFGNPIAGETVPWRSPKGKLVR